MAKGFFTQGAVLLLSQPVSLERLAGASGRALQKRRQKSGNPWMGGESLVGALESHPTGSVLIDVVEQPWPDHLGDPKTEPELFGAWGMGFLCPLSFPGNLTRALQQPSPLSDAQKTAVKGHRAFVRVLFSYVVGAGPETPVLPEPYEPKAELDELIALSAALLQLPEAIAVFNPNGETLHTASSLEETLSLAREEGVAPLLAYSLVRLLRPDSPGWLLMDSVGMGQVDAPDHEACFPEDAFDPNEVANFLRNASAYILDKGEVVESGDTMNGPGDVNWQGFLVDESLTSPPRRVYRWLPLDGSRAPDALLPPDAMPDPEPPRKKRGLFGWLKS